MKETYLVTGAAGFIGYYLSQRLLEEGNSVIGVDNINDYYDITLKYTRLNLLKGKANFSFHQIDISNKPEVEKIFKMYQID